MPSTTVVIPSFNRRSLLERSIESVTSQTAQGFVLVVVDDASTDDSGELREKVESMGHLWIRIADNAGPAAARNTGAAATDSDWIAFLDSDDLWMPEKFERQREWHEGHPESRISQVREEWVRKGTVVKKPSRWEQKEGDLFSESVERCAIGPSCVMIRRDLWNESGGFDPRYRVCEDYELWLRISRTEKVGLVPGPALVRKYGGHSDQLSTTVPALDRFRLVALAELLDAGQLTGEQEEIVRRGLREKAEILAEGARKRGHTERADVYTRISRDDLTLLRGGPNPLESEEWTE